MCDVSGVCVCDVSGVGVMSGVVVGVCDVSGVCVCWGGGGGHLSVCMRMCVCLYNGLLHHWSLSEVTTTCSCAYIVSL